MLEFGKGRLIEVDVQIKYYVGEPENSFEKGPLCQFFMCSISVSNKITNGFLLFYEFCCIKLLTHIRFPVRKTYGEN